MSTERETVEKVNIFQKTESIDLNWTIGIGCHDRSLTSSKILGRRVHLFSEDHGGRANWFFRFGYFLGCCVGSCWYGPLIGSISEMKHQLEW